MEQFALASHGAVVSHRYGPQCSHRHMDPAWASASGLTPRSVSVKVSLKIKHVNQCYHFQNFYLNSPKISKNGGVHPFSFNLAPHRINKRKLSTSGALEQMNRCVAHGIPKSNVCTTRQQIFGRLQAAGVEQGCLTVAVRCVHWSAAFQQTFHAFWWAPSGQVKGSFTLDVLNNQLTKAELISVK